MEEFLKRYLKRQKGNSWSPWRVVYVTGRIRSLLAKTKLVRGRKRREWFTHSTNLQGWRECRERDDSIPALHALTPGLSPDLILGHLRVKCDSKWQCSWVLFATHLHKSSPQTARSNTCMQNSLHKESLAHICIYSLKPYFTICLLICN